MRQLPRWQQVPRLYRALVILFAVIDVIVLVIAASGLRSWFHAGGSVVQSVVYLLFLAILFAHTPPRDPLMLNQRFSSTARIVAGIAILFLSGWILVGGIVESARGVELPEYILEGTVFAMFLTAMGAMLVGGVGRDGGA